MTAQFFIYKHTNRNFVINKMNTINWESNDSSKDLTTQDSFSMEQLRAMRLVAKMKEAADKSGAGFVGGFISPTGQRFMMSNIDPDDIQHQAISSRLDQLQAEHLESLEDLMKDL